MKRLIAFILVLTMILSLGISASASGQRLVYKQLYYRGISIYVDDTELIPQDVNGKSTEPFIIEGTTYLPVRALAGALGLAVGWDGETNTITLTSGGEVNMGSGEAAATFDIIEAEVYYKGVRIYLDGKELIPTDANGRIVEPFLMGGSTYLPLRAIATALGLGVGWDEKTNTITLSTPFAGSEPVWRLVKTTTGSKTGASGALTNILETKYLYSDSGLFLGMLADRRNSRILDMDCSYTDNGKLESLSLLTAGQELVINIGYNPNGKLGDISAKRNGEFLAHSTFTFFNTGSYITELVKDADGKVCSTVHYQFDEKGNCCRISTDLPKEGSESYRRVLTVSREFDDAGRMLSEITTIIALPELPDLSPGAEYSSGSSGSSDNPGSSITLPPVETISEAYYTYDAMGNLLRYSFSSDEESFSYSYAYDKLGREISCVFESKAAGYKKTVTTTVWSTDGLSCIATSKTGQKITTEFRFYNEDGLLIRSEFSSGNSTTVTVYEYELLPAAPADQLLDFILGELGQSR